MVPAVRVAFTGIEKPQVVKKVASGELSQIKGLRHISMAHRGVRSSSNKRLNGHGPTLINDMVPGY